MRGPQASQPAWPDRDYRLAEQGRQRIVGVTDRRLQRRPAAAVLHQHPGEPLREDGGGRPGGHQADLQTGPAQRKPAERESDQQVRQPLHHRVVAGEQQVAGHPGGLREIRPAGVVPQLQRQLRCQQPRAQQVGEHRAGQQPPGGEREQAPRPQPEEGQDAEEQDGVMHQDDGDVHLQGPQAEPDGGHHQGPQGHPAPRRPELAPGVRLLLAGGQRQAHPGQDREQRRSPARERQAHPGGGECRVRLEGGQDVGGHHPQQRQAPGGVDAGQAGRPGRPAGGPGTGSGTAGGHASIVSRGPVTTLVFEYMFE